MRLGVSEGALEEGLEEPVTSVTHSGFLVLCDLLWWPLPRPPHLRDSNKQHLCKHVDGGTSQGGEFGPLLVWSVLLLPIFAASSLGREVASQCHCSFQTELRGGGRGPAGKGASLIVQLAYKTNS